MKGQAALEFTMLIAMGALLLIVIMIIVSSIANNYDNKKKISIIDSFAKNIQEELIMSAEVHIGYNRKLILPDYIGHYKYSISNNHNSLTINADGIIINLDIPETSGNLIKGVNYISNNYISEGGFILITH